MSCGQKGYKGLSSCHEKNEKKRCPFCGSLHTKRKGCVKSLMKTKRGVVPKTTQRYLCQDCGKSFSTTTPGSRKRFSDDLKADAVKDYICTKSSLSEVGKRFGVHGSTIHRWVMKQAGKPRASGEAKIKDFSGFVCFDGKVLKVGGEKRTLLWASDTSTGKLLFYRYSRHEDTVATQDFLTRLAEILPTEVRGITTDFGRGKCFLKPVEAIFPGVPQRICHVHFLRYLYLQVPKTRRSKYFWRNGIFKTTVKAIVKSQSKDEAKALLHRLLALRSFFPASYHKRFLKSLERNLDRLLAYKNILDLPSTSNIIESWNRTLNRKLKNMDGFKSDETCKAFLQLWFDAQIMKESN